MRAIGLVLGVTIGCSAATAGAAVVDGVADTDYDPPRSVQTTQTSLGETEGYGSELDAAFARVAGDTLHLLFAGTFNRFFSEPLTFPNSLQIYIDAGSGGQAVLTASNPPVGQPVSLTSMTGLAFDPGFAPDYWLQSARLSGGANGLHVYFAELPAGGGGAGYLVGRGNQGPPGSLVGGEGAINPFGILASFDPSNTAGVTTGCEASSGAGVTSGIEFAIPLAAIGSPTGAIRVCAVLVRFQGATSSVSNQVLGPLPPGTCELGLPSGVSFATHPGLQYFEIADLTDISRATWGRLKTRYR